MNEETPMRQQVDVWVHLTYDADATLSAEKLKTEISEDLAMLTRAGEDEGAAVSCQDYGIATIREEATIYSDGDGPADMLITLKRLVEAFPPTLHRNEAQRRALADARSIVAMQSGTRYQIQVEIGYAWECGEWIECTENGITGERMEATHATRAEAQAELDDMFKEMERQGMDFARSDWRVAKIGGAA